LELSDFGDYMHLKNGTVCFRGNAIIKVSKNGQAAGYVDILAPLDSMYMISDDLPAVCHALHSVVHSEFCKKSALRGRPES
jgi:hypothetical protein